MFFWIQALPMSGAATVLASMNRKGPVTVYIRYRCLGRRSDGHFVDLGVSPQCANTATNRAITIYQPLRALRHSEIHRATMTNTFNHSGFAILSEPGQATTVIT